LENFSSLQWCFLNPFKTGNFLPNALLLSHYVANYFFHEEQDLETMKQAGFALCTNSLLHCFA
jgi:hypothetical protein